MKALCADAGNLFFYCFIISDLDPSGDLTFGFHFDLIWVSFFLPLRVSDGCLLGVIFPVSEDEDEDERVGYPRDGGP